MSRRRVFYIPGYDPVPPRRYRELYRDEGARQATVSGYGLSVRGGKGARFGWQVEARIDGTAIDTRIEVLAWSDLVKRSMAGGIAGSYLALVRTAWVYLASGALWRLARLRRGPVIAALYPVAVLSAQLAAAGLIAVAAWRLGAGAGPAAGAIGATAGMIAGYGLLRLFRRMDHRIFAHYLMHDYGYAARRAGAEPPELRARMAAFEDAIAEALRSEDDEVLVVGHSSGAHIAISVLAGLIREGRVPEGGPALSLLTLGHVVPMVAFLPGAGRLRCDLAWLAVRPELFWLDVTAPGDACCFALCDPVAVSVPAPEGKRWPLVISASFSRTLAPQVWARIRRRYFRLHFQYLCAFDFPESYDYFRITAGPQTLAARFADHPPSPSRIIRMANRRWRSP